MDALDKEFVFAPADGRSFAVKVDGKTIVCSEHIAMDLIFLRLKENISGETLQHFMDTIQKTQDSGFNRKIVVVLPPFVEVLKLVPSVQGLITNVPCPLCGGNMRNMGQDQIVCLSCGHEKTNRAEHLRRVMRGEGVTNL
jgi:hypothetical protein